MSIYDEMINRNPFKLEAGYTGINAEGHLTIGSVDSVELAERYGTPLFVFCEEKIRQNYRRIKSAFAEHCGDAQVCYALKSNSLLTLLRVLRKEGAYADVVSQGEHFKAREAGFDSRSIVVNGNNKSAAELYNAVDSGALINVDSCDELESILSIASGTGRKARIAIRVNPNLSADVIDEFATGVGTSKFGIDMDSGDAYKAYFQASQSDCLEIEGIHVHIGSQVENSRFYRRSTEKVMDFCLKLRDELNIIIKYVNLGGGFGIPFEYLDHCDAIEKFAEVIGAVIADRVSRYGMKAPTVLIEPGGFICGSSGMLLTRVGAIKDKATKKLAALDGGGDIMQRATQGWYTYRALCAGRMNDVLDSLYDLVGPLCYEGDVLARDRLLPKLLQGDVVAFADAGAYTVSLMNHYNCRPNPAVVLVGANRGVSIIKKRESMDDLLSGEK